MAADANYLQAVTMISDKFPSITKDFSEMEKLLQYCAPGKKLPRLKLRRKVKSPVRSSKRNREQAESATITDESEAEAASNNMVLEEDYAAEERASELQKVERAKEKADAKVSQLQVAAQLAYAEVERLSKEIEALEASRLAKSEVERLSEEIQFLKDTTTLISPQPSPSPVGGKRWSSEVMNVRLNNKKLNPEDYEMDVEDKGDEIDIKLRIK